MKIQDGGGLRAHRANASCQTHLTTNLLLKLTNPLIHILFFLPVNTINDVEFNAKV